MFVVKFTSCALSLLSILMRLFNKSSFQSTKFPLSVLLFGLILSYFYFASFNPYISKIWTYGFKKETFSNKYKYFKSLFKSNSNGVKAFVYPGTLFRYIFKQTNCGDWIVSRRLKGSQHNALFITDEVALENPSKEDIENINKSERKISEIVSFLKQKGAAKVLLIPIPTKLSILGNSCNLNHFAHGTLGFINKQDYKPISNQSVQIFYSFYDYFQKHGVPLVDLYKIYKEQNSIQEPLYILEDSHWSSKGNVLCSKEVLNNLFPEIHSKIYRTNQTSPSKSQNGDLQGYFNIPNWSSLRNAPLNYVDFDLKVNERPVCTQNIILLGTSYSCVQNHKLAKTIERVSGCKVIDLSVPAKGPVESIKTLLAQHAEEIKNSIIIWEFPIRFTADPSNFKFNIGNEK